MIFSSFGYQIRLYDTNSQLLAKAPGLIEQELRDLCEKKLARGDLSLEDRMALITTTDSLKECLDDVCHVQECVFDNLALKQDVFKQVDDLIGDNNYANICSSTSVLLPSLVFEKVTKHRSQCLVAHPINPPTHVRLVELVAMDETREEIIIRTRLLMDEIGQKPVVLRKEISGFALNRLQYAVFREAFRLVHDGVMSPEDVDTVVSEGLGPRYAFMGPWMTAHLNAEGLGDYLERYADGIYKVSLECDTIMPIEGEAAQQIVDAMVRQVPIEHLGDKKTWRNKCLMELARIKSQLGN